ncbi:MAG: ABC transporter permease [Lachnospiraceae bacterium]|nr:ABC transporter permease [Lachnospiraceae bacterium]
MELLLSLLRTTIELGLISSLTVLALYVSYSCLNVCDLSTDGSFTLGACVGAVVALSGHPFLAIPAAMIASALSGLITAFLQTKLRINSLLAGIVVNTGLYSINIAIMGNASLLNLNGTKTIFSMLKDALKGTAFENYYIVIIAGIFVVLSMAVIVLFLKTRLGLAIKATGDNPKMVQSSSINPHMTTIVGLCFANAFTGLSGCLLAQSQKAVNIDIGSGMVTVALASLLIGNTIIRKDRSVLKTLAAVLGSIIFRLVYTIALRFHMPAYMLKLISSVIVIIALAGPTIWQAVTFKKGKPSAARRDENA